MRSYLSGYKDSNSNPQFFFLKLFPNSREDQSQKGEAANNSGVHKGRDPSGTNKHNYTFYSIFLITYFKGTLQNRLVYNPSQTSTQLGGWFITKKLVIANPEGLLSPRHNPGLSDKTSPQAHINLKYLIIPLLCRTYTFDLRGDN